MRVKCWEKIAIIVTAVLAVTVLYIRMAAPELLGIPFSPEGDREPLPISLTTVIYNNLEERLGLAPDEMEGKPPEEIDKLSEEVKNAISLFSHNTIVAAHEWLDRYFWPKDESRVISLKQLKQEIAELELKWESAVAEIEKFNVLPVVEAYINDVNKAFEEVRKSSWINRKPLVTAHNILHDLSVLWAEGTKPPPYGVTSTEEILRGMTVEFYSDSNIYAIPDHNLVNSLPKEQHPIANRTAQLPGFTYDEENDRYVHEETGIWYVIKDGKRVLPAEQYIDPKYEIYYINIEPRPDDAWVHVSNTEIVVQPGDTLGRIDAARIDTLKEGLYYRMNPARLFIGGNSYFLENKLENPSQIYPGQILVYRNYVDRDAPEEFHEHAKSLGGRYYVTKGENGILKLASSE